MFMKSRKRPFIKASGLSSLIASDVEIVGDVHFTSGIRIDGRVKGMVIGRATDANTRPLLVLSETGCIDGGVACGDAVINGTIVGDLSVEHLLELQAGARVTGAIRYQHLQMEIGASVRGQLQRSEAAAPADNVVEFAADAAVRK